MTHTLSILGCTGSIGRQAIEVSAALGLSVEGLTANRNTSLLEEQVRQTGAKLAVVMAEDAYADLKTRLADTQVRVAAGMEGLLEAATLPQADTVLTAVVGMVGLRPTLAAVRAGKRIALANKETLVCGGELVMAEAKRAEVEILPVDSEHSAIFQCLQGCGHRSEVRRLILTASGGPFFGKKREELAGVTAAQALNHPNWSMGAKVTVDSSTLMNKGLEFIEAMRLFDLPPEKISVLIHRQSIIHSLVEYCDNGILAQLGTPDMRLPIQYAFTWPERREGPAAPLDLTSCGPLTFAQPDVETFPCLGLALAAARQGGTATAVLNGANEVAVERFLAGEIGFYDIPRLVEKAMTQVPSVVSPTLEDILEADDAARKSVMR